MRSSRILGAALTAAALLLAPGALDAQWSLEGRLGATIPTGDLSDELNQTGGLALAGDVMYTLGTNVSVYGGIGHHRFNCDGCAADVTTTGLDGGVKLLFGSDERAMPWVRGGLLVHKPESEGHDGDWGLGLDSGVGIDWAVSDGLTLVPALRYQSYSPDGATLSWLTLDLAAHFHFGG